jgi:hypothetical protein
MIKLAKSQPLVITEVVSMEITCLINFKID